MKEHITDYERFEKTMAILKIRNGTAGNSYEISDSTTNSEHEFYFKNFDELKEFIIESDNALKFENITGFIKSIELKVIKSGFKLDSNFGLKLS
jgi:hypothetical protein